MWPVGRIAPIPSAVDQYAALAGRHRLGGDLGYVPRAHALSAHGEQHPLAIRQHLRPVHEFALVGRNQQLLRAARARHSHDALELDIQNHVVGTPAGAKWIHNSIGEGHRRATAHCDFLQLPSGPEPDRLPVG